MKIQILVDLLGTWSKSRSSALECSSVTELLLFHGAISSQLKVSVSCHINILSPVGALLFTIFKVKY